MAWFGRRRELALLRMQRKTAEMMRDVMIEVAEKSAEAIRHAAFGFGQSEDRPAPEPSPDLFGPQGGGFGDSVRVPMSEMVDDPWADNPAEDPALIRGPDGSFTGWDQIGLPTPPGEQGDG